MPVIHASHPCYSSMIEISSSKPPHQTIPTKPNQTIPNHTNPYQTIPYLQPLSVVKYHCNFNPQCHTAVLPFSGDCDCKPFSACLILTNFWPFNLISILECGSPSTRKISYQLEPGLVALPLIMTNKMAGLFMNRF